MVCELTHLLRIIIYLFWVHFCFVFVILSSSKKQRLFAKFLQFFIFLRKNDFIFFEILYCKHVANLGGIRLTLTLWLNLSSRFQSLHWCYFTAAQRDNVFKGRPSRDYGRQPFKHFTWSTLEYFVTRVMPLRRMDLKVRS